jgi:hypothetical protein
MALIMILFALMGAVYLCVFPAIDDNPRTSGIIQMPEKPPCPENDQRCFAATGN